MSIGDDARRLLRRHNFGVLSTHSVDMPGYPFGSVTPYALDRAGEPVILISSLAQHTRNVKADPKVSLTVLDPNPREQQAAGRLTVLADAVELAEIDEPTRLAYVAHHPDSADYVNFHDFSFWRLSVRRARFIGGFGKIHWVEPAKLVLANPLADDEAGVIEHMNADHADALALYCRNLLGLEPETVTMSGIDAEGFDMLVDGVHHRVELESAISTPEDARVALVALVRRAREAAAGRI